MRNIANTLFSGGILFLVTGSFYVIFILFMDSNPDITANLLYILTILSMSFLGLGYLFSTLSNEVRGTKISMEWKFVLPFGMLLFAIGFVLLLFAVSSEYLVNLTGNTSYSFSVTILQFGLIVVSGFIVEGVSDWFSEITTNDSTDNQDPYVDY